MAVRKDGTLARFAVEPKRVYRPQGNPKVRVHPKLFQPNRQDELSVTDAQGLTRAEVAGFGENVVSLHRTAKKLYGWAEIDTSKVLELDLKVVPDEPPERHANIVNWPKERQDKKTKSQQLARDSTPVLL